MKDKKYYVVLIASILYMVILISTSFFLIYKTLKLEFDISFLVVLVSAIIIIFIMAIVNIISKDNNKYSKYKLTNEEIEKILSLKNYSDQDLNKYQITVKRCLLFADELRLNGYSKYISDNQINENLINCFLELNLLDEAKVYSDSYIKHKSNVAREEKYFKQNYKKIYNSVFMYAKVNIENIIL